MNIEKITQGKNLTDTEHTVLEYILDHLDTVQTEGVRGVARANYTSTSTIMRLARKMNYSGFVDMCYKLRSLVETPRQTMQEEEDFLNGFSTQSLLNYNTKTDFRAFLIKASCINKSPHVYAVTHSSGKVISFAP